VWVEGLEPQTLTKKKRKKMHHAFFLSSYRDHELAETVSTIETSVPTKVWDGFDLDGKALYHWDLMFIDEGEIVVDSRGRGTFQK